MPPEKATVARRKMYSPITANPPTATTAVKTIATVDQMLRRDGRRGGLEIVGRGGATGPAGPGRLCPGPGTCQAGQLDDNGFVICPGCANRGREPIGDGPRRVLGPTQRRVPNGPGLGVPG